MMTFMTRGGDGGFSQGNFFHGGSIGDFVMWLGSGAQVAEQGGSKSGHAFCVRSTGRGSKRGVG